MGKAMKKDSSYPCRPMITRVTKKCGGCIVGKEQRCRQRDPF